MQPLGAGQLFVRFRAAMIYFFGTNLKLIAEKKDHKKQKKDVAFFSKSRFFHATDANPVFTKYWFIKIEPSAVNF